MKSKWKILLTLIFRFLTLPTNQTAVMDTRGLSSMHDGLKTASYVEGVTGVNALTNITCLCPSNAAFKAAGSPQGAQSKDGIAALRSTLVRHQLSKSYYYKDFKDGDIIYSVDYKPIKVVVASNGSVFLNDAQIIHSDYITNNGNLLVLDNIMTEYTNATINSTSPSSTSTGSSTSTSSTASATATKKSAAGGTFNAPTEPLLYVSGVLALIVWTWAFLS
jgi:Fasciclin domain